MKKIYYLILVLFSLSQQILFADTNNTKNSLQNTKGNTTVYGPWITESWSMSHPYNIFCPDDPYSSRKCLAGEIPVAFAHIINCHKNIDYVYFDDSDDYFSDPIYIDDDHLFYNFPSFPELNIFLDDICCHYHNSLSLSYELISALNFACGIATNHQYVSGGTLLSNAYHVFINKFNYQNAIYTITINNDFYITLKSNMVAENPAILGIYGFYGSTIVLCDGYNTDDDTYHINFMWGGSYNGWYSLPDGLPSGFNTIDAAVVDIEPPAYSVDELLNDAFILHNFPNPFQHNTKFSFYSNNPIINAELKIYNIKGQLVRELGFSASDLGFHEVVWDGKNENGKEVTPGIYFYVLKTKEDKIIKKMIKMY